MKLVSWPTAAVVIAGIGLLAVAVVRGADRETIAAIAAAFVALAGAMRSYLGGAQ